jgi:hypothetical protein
MESLERTYAQNLIARAKAELARPILEIEELSDTLWAWYEKKWPRLCKDFYRKQGILLRAEGIAEQEGIEYRGPAFYRTDVSLEKVLFFLGNRIEDELTGAEVDPGALPLPEEEDPDAIAACKEEMRKPLDQVGQLWELLSDWYVRRWPVVYPIFQERARLGQEAMRAAERAGMGYAPPAFYQGKISFGGVLSNLAARIETRAKTHCDI